VNHPDIEGNSPPKGKKKERVSGAAAFQPNKQTNRDKVGNGPGQFVGP